MKTILITGINGFIGTSLFNALNKEHVIYGISRRNVGLPNCSVLDLTERERTVRFFESNQFDIVVHTAMILANPDNKADLVAFFQNVTIETNLLEALMKQKQCHLINFSSSAVYPNVDGHFGENDIIDPSVNGDGLYGLAKFNGEMLFKHLLPSHVRQLHLRVGFVYGKGMYLTRIHEQFKRELLEKNTITVFGNGKRTIPQIKINSLVEKLRFFINHSTEGTYNVADENISLEKLAQNLIEKYGNAESRILYVEKGNQYQFGLKLRKLNELLNV
jgi:nucleoside-diphosphate-sugar epimerase